MKRYVFLLVLICIVVALSCQKTYNHTGTPPVVQYQFSDLKSTPQNISVSAGRDTIVFGTKGTAIHFYTNSFKDASGHIITSGNVSIQLVEMCKPGDMVANRAPTTTASGMLQSGGEINIVATMNGSEVFANKYGIGFKQTSSSTQSMELYYGSNTNNDTITTWTQGNNTTPGTTTTGTADSSHAGWQGAGSSGFQWGTGFYNLIDSCTSFNWVNCDRLYSSTGANTTVQVSVPDTSFTPQNTEIFLIIPSLNSMTQSDSRQTYIASTNTFTLGNDYNLVPVGIGYELVVITNKNGIYYYYEVSGTTTLNMIDTAAMAVDTRADIVARMEAL